MSTAKTIIITAFPKSSNGLESMKEVLIPVRVRNSCVGSVVRKSIQSSQISEMSAIQRVHSESLCERDSENQEIRSRKRKLEHLTLEEKLMRKKLKNRVAAQSSRDRKKARMDELEKEVKQLTQKYNSLTCKCDELRKQNERLLAENEELKNRLSVRTNVGCGSVEPAASINAPLPKGQESQLALLLTRLFLSWSLIAQRSTSSSSRSWQRAYSQVEKVLMSRKNLSRHLTKAELLKKSCWEIVRQKAEQMEESPDWKLMSVVPVT